MTPKFGALRPHRHRRHDRLPERLFLRVCVCERKGDGWDITGVSWEGLTAGQARSGLCLIRSNLKPTVDCALLRVAPNKASFHIPPVDMDRRLGIPRVLGARLLSGQLLFLLAGDKFQVSDGEKTHPSTERGKQVQSSHPGNSDLSARRLIRSSFISDLSYRLTPVDLLSFFPHPSSSSSFPFPFRASRLPSTPGSSHNRLPQHFHPKLSSAPHPHPTPKHQQGRSRGGRSQSKRRKPRAGTFEGANKQRHWRRWI